MPGPRPDGKHPSAGTTPGGYGIRPYGKSGRPFCGLYVGRGALTPPRGVGDAAPYSGKPQTFPLWQTPAAACGQAALRIARKELPDPRGVGDAAPYSGKS